MLPNTGRPSRSKPDRKPAETLLGFFHDVNRDNLRINFDPANMILYGTGDPIEALGVLRQHVITVHCKDGDWPPKDKPGALGEEKPLGQGSVGIDRFIAKLKEIGYKGPLSIEREVPDPIQRMEDIRMAVALLPTAGIEVVRARWRAPASPLSFCRTWCGRARCPVPTRPSPFSACSARPAVPSLAACR